MLKKKTATIFLGVIVLFACSNPNTKTDATPAQTKKNSILAATPAGAKEDTDQTSGNFVATKSDNGVTATITWTYVDEHRLTFEVRVTGIRVPTGYQLPCPVRVVSVTDAQGYLYEKYENGYGESENLSAICSYQKDADTFAATYNFYHERPDILQVNVSLTISLGNFDLFTEDGQQILLPDFGTYGFDLSILAKDRLTITPNETIELSGVKATINRVEINPAFTAAELCLQYEDHHGWYPNVLLIVNNKDVPANPELTRWVNYDPNSDWYESFTSFRCYRFIFPVDLITNSTLQTRDFVISLSNLEINITEAATQDECAGLRHEIQADHPGLDFVCHIDYRGDGYGFALEVTKTPFGMSMENANKIIEESFKKNISGPWLFSIELP